MNRTCGSTCKESNITFSYVTPHIDIQRPCEVNSCNPEGFLGRHPVCGKWSLDLVIGVDFSHLARKTYVQHLLYGLTCTQNPKFFSEFRQNDPNSQVMKAYVRLPNQQVNKVVLAVEQYGVTQVFGKLGALHHPNRISPSSRNGLNQVIFDSLGKSAFFRSASSSAGKHSAWTVLIQCRRA
jgi:hypothetical protein